MGKVLEQKLSDCFVENDGAMPAYIRVAKKDNPDLIGGVVTVPDFLKKRGIIHKEYPDDQTRIKAFKAEYKSAVTRAINDAKALKRPLFIHPLGIGVNGWDPEVAAGLFAEAIAEADPKGTLDITIPIYRQEDDSADKKFERSLSTLLSQKPEPNELDLSKESRKTEDNQQVLSKIIDKLVGNIENKRNGRLTSGTSSKKVESLKTLKKQVLEEKTSLELGSEKHNQYLQEILTLCERKRNPLHFWHTPESVNEYRKLLSSNNIPRPVSEVNNKPDV